MSQVHSPFKFLDSYQQADADVFFGREKETLDLYSALSGVKHLLVYGPSGSGKTSLIECGLRNQFSDADWFAISIRKGADINASVFAGINNALKEKIELDPVTKIPVDPQIEYAQAVEKLFAERYQPVYLLFDQFEELLISGQTDEKNTFFTLLNKLIRNKLPCRIILIMREEFIGHLSEFEPLCPSIFQHRFRVEKMGRKNVEEVIYNILEAPRYKAYFNVDDSRKLAESILSKLPDKRMEIELAHVQVFLGELWERALATIKDNELPVLSAGLIHEDDDLERILESFLKKQMNELEESYGENVPLELLAAMITDKFTKLQLSQAAIEEDLQHKKVVSKKPMSDLLKELEQRRIIRTLKVGDETQYEISHDLLALVVGQNLTEDMKMREKAGDIYKVYGERRGLFTQDDIDYLRPFQQSLAYPPDLQSRIEESIAAIKKQHGEELNKTRKRLRTVYSLLGGALLALIAAGYFWFNANEEKKTAIKQTKIAQTNSLISEAKGLVETDPTLALRLAQQAMLIQKNGDFESEANKIYAENSFYKIVGRHTDIVSSVAFSPDGKTILTGSSDQTARLWDLKGNTFQAFIGHKSAVSSVAFSPDGKTILTGSDDNTARLWDLKGNTIQEFIGHRNGVTSVAFSPDGKTILAGSWDWAAALWDLKGNPIQGFIGHTKGVTSVAFSPNGKTILTGSLDNTARLWDLKGNTLREFKGHTDGVTSVAFSPDGKSVLTSAGRTVRLWGLDGILKQEFIGRSGFINSIAFSPDGKTMLTGSETEEAELWGLDGKIRQEFKGHTGYVSSVAFSPDGKTILTGSEDNTARLWALDEKMKREFKGHTGYVYSVSFSPDGKTILTGSIDKTARLWDLKGNTNQEFKGHTDRVSSVAFSPDGKTILTGSDDKTARLWDLKGNTIQEFLGHIYVVSSVAFSPDGKTILTGSWDQTVRLWDLKGHTIQEFKGHTGFVFSVAFSPDGKTILSGSEDKTARLWDLKGNTIQEFIGHTKGVNSVAFSPDGKTILTGSGKTARLWGLDGKMKQEFIGHSKIISSVGFSPDGKTILTGSGDKIAILWGLNGKMKMEFMGHSEYINSVAFSPDGKTILTGSGDNTARLWDIDFIPLVDFLKSNEIEPLSKEQKEKYGIK